mmetsp:Transcript_39534/g.157014  ORF Transcript_39534/g.157014 Transcript_39534/m.157014 type:complete len:264 (+) Transcript_39534:699-1490(+)
MSTIARLLDLCIDAVTTTQSEQAFRTFVKVTAALLLTRKDEFHFRGSSELVNSYCHVIRSAAFLFLVLLEKNRSNVEAALSLLHKQAYCEKIWSQIRDATEISVQLSLSVATKILCDDGSNSGKNFRDLFTGSLSVAESKAFFSISKDSEESIREFVSKINLQRDAQTRCFTTTCRMMSDGKQTFEAKATFIKLAPELCADELEFSFSDPDEYRSVKQAIENRTFSACSGRALRKASRAFLISNSARSPEVGFTYSSEYAKAC